MMLLLLISGLGLVFLALRRRRACSNPCARQDRWQAAEGMPEALRICRLVASEHPIATRTPVPLHGRIDQLFRSPQGELILLETKTRPRHQVHLADRIQLSVYRLILSAQGTHRLGDYAYVRTVVSGHPFRKVRYHKTMLLPETTVLQLWGRYQALKQGRAKPHCRCRGRFHPLHLARWSPF